MARDPGNHFARVIVIDGKSGHKIKEKTWAMMAKKKVTVQALWNVGTDFVLVPFAVISYALGDEAGAHEAIAA